jgi:NNP family nitrate/nitrite transporter-like MFS transporter
VIVMVFLQPMLTGSFFPAGFAALSKIVPDKARSLAVSLAIFVAYLVGAGFIPVILGVLGDAGMFGIAFVLVGCAILINLFFIPLLRT